MYVCIHTKLKYNVCLQDCSLSTVNSLLAVDDFLVTLRVKCRNRNVTKKTVSVRTRYLYSKCHRVYIIKYQWNHGP